MQNEMWALVAEIEAIKTKIEAMKIENISRFINDESPAYSENDFFSEAAELRKIAEKLRSNNKR